MDAVPYASAAPESADASDTVMMGSADGMPMSKVKEDSFGTNNQVSMIGIKVAFPTVMSR